MGRKDIEDALRRLDTLTQEEVRMAAAQILKLTHSIDHTIKDVDSKMDTVLSGVSSAFAIQGTYLDFAYVGQMERT